MTAGARQSKGCEILSLDARTVQRWRRQDVGDDGRAGPKTTPANKLTAAERREVLSVVNSPEYRDRSPKQIVPSLADQGEYLASESTMYRILREEDQLTHRASSNRSGSAIRPQQHWVRDTCGVCGELFAL